MERKCKEPMCYSDAVCADHRCAVHTRAKKRLGKYGTRTMPRKTIPYIGVELECFAPNDSVYGVMLAQQFRAHQDGSLPSLGCEFKICREVKWAIKFTCDLAGRLAAVGAKVNSTCGLHVHLDMRMVSSARKEEVLTWLATWQEWFFKLMPPSRRANNFCERITPYNHTNHYTWAHATHYQTIEIRVHGGTLNQHKIKAWLLAMNDLANLIRSGSPLPVIENGEPSAAQLLQIFPTKEGRDYLMARLVKDGVLRDAQLLGNSGLVNESEAS